ncbi:hypothetical protein NQZ68_031265 [Dissostichus eleginoides]|nr:hypothetical protein NQZ68_031265 [Dissostichus eleginoides]
MELADAEPVKAAIRLQGERLHQHEEKFSVIHQAVRDLAEQQHGLQASVNTQSATWRRRCIVCWHAWTPVPRPRHYLMLRLILILNSWQLLLLQRRRFLDLMLSRCLAWPLQISFPEIPMTVDPF